MLAKTALELPQTASLLKHALQSVPIGDFLPLSHGHKEERIHDQDHHQYNAADDELDDDIDALNNSV